MSSQAKEVKRDENVLHSSLSEEEKVKIALEKGAKVFKVIISGAASNIQGVGVHQLCEEIEKITEVSDTVRFTNNKNLVISTNRIETCCKLLKLTKLCNIDVVTRVIDEAITTKYIVKGVPKEFPLSYIEEKLLNNGVKASQIIRFKDSDVNRSSSIILIKELGKQLRSEVKLGRLLFKTEPYRPTPPICYNCLGINHIAKYCKGQKKCARCGAQHDSAS